MIVHGPQDDTMNHHEPQATTGMTVRVGMDQQSFGTRSWRKHTLLSHVCGGEQAYKTVVAIWIASSNEDCHYGNGSINFTKYLVNVAKVSDTSREKDFKNGLCKS